MLQTLYQYITVQTLAWAIVALPLAGAAVNGMVACATARNESARLRSLVSFAGCLFPGLAFGAAVLLFWTLAGFEGAEPSAITGPLIKWTLGPGLVVDVGLRADQLSLTMALLVAGVGALIHLSAVGSLAHDAGQARFFALMNLSLFFMLLLVLADNLVLLFAGWEGVALCSSLLIGFWFEDPANARAGIKAFVVGRIGDVGFVAAILLIYGVMLAAGAAPSSGTFNFEVMERYSAAFVPVATAVSLLIFAGAAGMSAQAPLHAWLLDSAAGPAPASALINTVTMAAAGVYLVVRLNFIFALSPTALQVVATTGAVTAVLAATMGLAATDLKKILASSTISQLGFMFLAAGVGAFSAAIFQLVTHALFKALLFLSAGSIIAALGGEQDVRRMGGLKRLMPLTAWTFLIAAAALAGIAPTAGFFSIGGILWQLYERGYGALWAAGFLGVGLTAFSIFRAAGFIFFGESRISPERWKRVSEAPVSMALPMMLLATLTLLGGILGVPPALHGADRLGRWLGGLISYEVGHAPQEGSGMEIVLLVVALIWSVHFSVLGGLIYAQKRSWPERVARRIWPLHLVVGRTFFVDELSQRLFVRPLVWISRRLLWNALDQTLVGALLVNGTGRAMGFAAQIASKAQTGDVSRYLLYALLGAAAVVGVMVL